MCVQLLIRALRPLRVGIKDLIVQKNFLLRQVKICDPTITFQIQRMEELQKVLLEVIDQEYQVEKQKPATFRGGVWYLYPPTFLVAVIAVIAARRLLAFLRSPIVGKTARIGRYGPKSFI